MAASGHGVLGLLAGIVALIAGPCLAALGVAAGTGSFGGKPNWLLGGVLILAGVFGVVAGVAGVALGWRAYRSS